MQAHYDTVLRHARLATMSGHDYGLIEDGALAWRDSRIVYAGPDAGLPADAAAGHEIDAAGALVTPGLIDCHTHLVFAGQRAGEFARRLAGESYEAIARSGGGIAATVRATRAADDAALLAAAGRRLAALITDGVTTVEVKSGYGLDDATERRLLTIARALGPAHGVTVHATYLGLHALAPEWREDRAAYVDAVAAAIPRLAGEGLVDSVDAYCEGIAFDAAEVARVFAAAGAAGLPVRLHADQLSDGGGASLAARHRALSADHLEYCSEAGVAALAGAGTVAVLLPAAYYALGEIRLPPIAALRRAGVPLAVASDLNPGTSPMLSLRLALNMACTLFRLTPLESLRGATVHAAAALGLGARKGRLAPGMDADLVLWDAGDPAELSYWIGGTLARRVIAAGRTIATLAG